MNKSDEERRKTMWYNETGKDCDVVLASRVALNRNLEDFPFTDRMTGEQAKKLVETVKAVYPEADGWTFTDLETADAETKKRLAEQNIISRELAEKKGAAALFEKNGVTVTVGGENHVRIEAVRAGNDLEGAMNAAFEAEALLDEKTSIAFTEQFGYVTRNPGELGTGMTASATLHLPVSADTGWLGRISFRLAKDGISLRSVDRGGAATDVYLAASRVAMGVDEDGILKRVSDTVEALVSKERELRGKLTEEYKEDLAEYTRRSYGSLVYAERLGMRELMGMYSRMRLAASLELVGIPVGLVDQAMFGSLPHTVSCGAGEDEDIGKKRAAYVRELMKKAPIYAS